MSREVQARRIAIISDGNRRWARARGLPVTAAYDIGIATAWARVRDALEFGIREITMFSFSTENWRRPQSEVGGLMDLAERRIIPEARIAAEEGVKVRFIGRTDRLPARLIQQMREAERLSASNRAMTLCIAFDYGGRAELINAAARYRGGGEEELRRLLYAPEIHDPEVLIRTGGDKRLSNFLLFQSAYTELVFREEYWPDFTRQSFEACLAEFDRRRSRIAGR